MLKSLRYINQLLLSFDGFILSSSSLPGLNSDADFELLRIAARSVFTGMFISLYWYMFPHLAPLAKRLGQIDYGKYFESEGDINMNKIL